MSDLNELPVLLKAIRREMREQYLRDDAKPWIVGFSAGKDSTLVAQLLFETLLSIPPDERSREVFIVSNDTLVESPVFQGYVDAILDRIEHGVAALQVPVSVVRTRPEVAESFWVNLLGRGYPAPNRNFRWCTDRMKIRPTTRFIKDKACASGQVILLLGVRRAESIARARRIDGYAESVVENHYSPHNDIPGCLIYRPILHLSNDVVWAALMTLRPPWGGTHKELVTLYRNARGGECPFVVGEDDAPSCGSSSARFGCWTCTVVEKDHSLEGLIDSGFDHLEPLADFRDRLKAVSADPEFRSKTRRNGQPGLGPLTLHAREMLLAELLQIQDQMSLPLISIHEVRLIKDIWAKDESTYVVRKVEQLLQSLETTGDHQCIFRVYIS